MKVYLVMAQALLLIWAAFMTQGSFKDFSSSFYVFVNSLPLPLWHHLHTASVTLESASNTVVT